MVEKYSHPHLRQQATRRRAQPTATQLDHTGRRCTPTGLSVSTEKNEKTVTGYGGVFRFGPLDGKEFRGYSHAMPTSSTLGEAMAIAAALGETPKDMPLTIYSDSTAANAKMNSGKKRWAKPDRKSVV